MTTNQTLLVPKLGLDLPEGWRLVRVNYTTYDSRPKDTVAGTWPFLVRDEVVDVEVALRNVVTDWMAEARAALNGAEPPDWPDHPMNWGDVIAQCPQQTFLQHGLVFLPLPWDYASEITLDHDEALIYQADVRPEGWLT